MRQKPILFSLFYVSLGAKMSGNKTKEQMADRSADAGGAPQDQYREWMRPFPYPELPSLQIPVIVKEKIQYGQKTRTYLSKNVTNLP